ncbi:BT_3987 domain-containing protein [Arcticibacter tournemirensis]
MTIIAKMYNIKWMTCRLLLLTVVLTVLGSGCLKDDEYSVDNEGTIYMSQAYQNRAALTLYDIDSIQDINFGASYGGLRAAASDITVSFQVDESLIADYNQRNGTSFIAFPHASYTIPDLNSVIRSGKIDSDPLKIKVDAKQLERGQPYMIPVRMISAGGGTPDPNLSIAYFRIDSLVRRERDITAQAALSVSNENNGGAGAGEGSPKLVDGDASTKYLTQTYTPGMWFQLRFPVAKPIGAYIFISGNDAESRDPKTWRFEASNNGTDWIVLDRRVDQLFSGRTFTRRFEVDNEQPYTYYRIVLEANNGSSIFQMSEWRVIEYY